jgi:Protein of unknown function (DUF2971)
MNLFHYCSNANLISILTSKEIWVSESSLSNDAMEGRWIREVWATLCGEMGLTELRKSQLLRQMDGLLQFVGAFVFCMSEQGDLLSQWRAYADNGAGVAIAFSRKYLEDFGIANRDREDSAFNVTLQRIEYDIANQKDLLRSPLTQALKMIEEGALSYPTLLTPETPEQTAERKHKFRSLNMHVLKMFGEVHVLKNPAFSEEREWRIISHAFAAGATKTESMREEFGYRARQDRIVPHRRIALASLQEQSITEIVLGPRNITPVWVVESLAQHFAWPDVRVHRSNASYRA